MAKTVIICGKLFEVDFVMKGGRSTGMDP